MDSPKFEQTKGLFVTGTGTGIGKTMVAGAIARQLVGRGRRVGVFKPIATGCQHRREGLVSQDAEFLAHCCDSRLSLAQINPVCYREPLAPMVAAERAKRQIDWRQLEQAYKNVTEAGEIVIVEGIGGVMVPLMKDYLVVDLMVEMALPVVIVAGSGLGTINHTLMTIEMCRKKNLEIAGVVINGYQVESRDISQESNPRVISEVSGVNVLTVIPYDENSCVEKGMLASDVREAVGLVKWEELI